MENFVKTVETLKNNVYMEIKHIKTGRFLTFSTEYSTIMIRIRNNTNSIILVKNDKICF